MKVGKKDIKILTPNEQIRNAILQKFETINDFAKVFERDFRTVEKYLSGNGIITDPLKMALIKHLSQGYDEIVIPETVQVGRIVQQINQCAELYKLEEDYEVLDLVRNLCQKNKMINELGIIYRVIGLNYFYRGKYTVAADLMELAISIISTGNKELICSSYSDLGLIYFYCVDYEKAEECFKKANNIKQEMQISNRKILFLLNYRWGILKNNLSKYAEAREKFQEAKQYADNITDVGNTIMNIGLTWKKEKEYEKAIEFYNSALRHIKEENQISLAIVYNNIANVYKQMGDFEKANSNIEKALDMVGEKSPGDRMVFTLTKMEIHFMRDEPDEAITLLLDLLAETADLFLYKKFITEGIRSVKAYAVKRKRREIMELLGGTLINLIQDAKEGTSYYRELKECLGEVYFQLYTEFRRTPQFLY